MPPIATATATAAPPDIGRRILDLPPITAALLAPAGPALWSDDDVYRLAEQPQAIGDALCLETHRHLRAERIGFVFRRTLSDKGGRVTLATTSVVGAKLGFFAALDFLVEVNWARWMFLTPLQRVALVDHELSHCGIETTAKGEIRRVLIAHDLEEFRAIVARWGLWKSDVAHFAAQLDLLAGAGPAAQ
jgi:hypothetical protein